MQAVELPEMRAPIQDGYLSLRVLSRYPGLSVRTLRGLLTTMRIRIPGATRAAVDRLDDAPAHPDATQVQPAVSGRSGVSLGPDHSLTKVPPREFPSGAGLEVSLELQRRLFLIELDDDEDAPGPAPRCGIAQAVVVLDQSCRGM